MGCIKRLQQSPSGFLFPYFYEVLECGHLQCEYRASQALVDVTRALVGSPLSSADSRHLQPGALLHASPPSWVCIYRFWRVPRIDTMLTDYSSLSGTEVKTQHGSAVSKRDSPQDGEHTR